MDSSHITLIAFSCIPAILIASLAYYFIQSQAKENAARHRFRLHQENQKIALPLRLQAYERLTLFLERIAIGNLVTRTKPYSDNLADYEQLLINTIDQEFEHNLTQQIYISSDCWNVIRTAKSATISIIRKTAMLEKVSSSDDLKEKLLRQLLDNTPPTDGALAFIKTELIEIFNA